ncbi:MAG: methylthioribulose 1-phosphate dehydratase [Acetobacter indonesiensis]|jgi:methylthioribulose-1-phosphate dehydratase|uniref:methylthioribulose 1-phosphate dehydratase n=1 Tax=Acetobacter indonesiensis TaxID=104101 RepID=UPI0020A33D8A|nr:methylthioribulose 1-phosphate dehydratase [Acetobacter indonesiensis]MCI1436936.1 methylthioribulose 1-phosphate dehydratase [Acetobacter indonesiensis]MCI1545684.1 methylthioribulose 1-phosphate dehydratase [Acetobacter indonesiensis]MCI1765152.1 methylthioribulose 1-phosphate dehydratase [Acetobacter indonesiensis]MCP1231603.1 methylthioribulose 1-phosphate dehydratase [Acetobacter indonesiensis]
MSESMTDFARAVQDILTAGQRMDSRGWVPATAGNISRRLADGRIAITRSGGHKGFLQAADVITVDENGKPHRAEDKPSAETLLHCQIYRQDPTAGAVLHGHSVASTVLSMIEKTNALQLADYEVLKVFEGQTTHATTVPVPLFDNDQDIARLAGEVEPAFGAMPAGYIIRGHGVYVWGKDMPTAMARLEGLEFLLACALERRKLGV